MRADRGFTLLEVLIALAIAGLAMAALAHGALQGIYGTRVAAHYEEAVARARSRLAGATPRPDLLTGTHEGDDGGGFHWRMMVTPVGVAETQRPALGSPGGADVTRTALYAVTVTESWRLDGAPREIRLDSKLLGPAPRRAP